MYMNKQKRENIEMVSIVPRFYQFTKKIIYRISLKMLSDESGLPNSSNKA